MRQLFLIFLLSVSFGYVSHTQDLPKEALQKASAVADKLIRDTRFSFKMTAQREELGMQVIDFRKQITKSKQLAFAIRSATVNTDTTIQFGVSHAGKLVIWINQKEVYRRERSKLKVPVEEAYSRFIFPDNFSARFSKGRNEIRIRYESNDALPVIFLRPVVETGDVDAAVKFDSTRQSSWLMMGPFNTRAELLMAPGTEVQPYYKQDGKIYYWEKAPQKILPELLIDSTLTYQRDPYADWNYSNGNTVWSLLPLAKTSGDKKYQDFVRDYSKFILTHYDYFKNQYDSLFIFRGSFHRLFRLTMLDDAGSAVLPFIELALTDKSLPLQKVIQPVADYILTKQVRLPDGTYCRPEPTKYTVWADDLFMSVPFLLRMGSLTGKHAYYDSAASQFVRFRKYLLDTQTGLYRHGWFSHTRQQAPVSWGRANGWIAWSTVELLSGLPKDHPVYPQVLASLKEQVAALVKHQAKDGFWHQVLNNPASYKETSCTAMFTLVIARGVREGWLDARYKENALKGWNAVQSKIDADGTVHGICRGTEIGFDEQFYFDRKTFDQDPRGLGSVITAGIEISKLGQ